MREDNPMNSILGRVITLLFKLPPAETYDVAVDHDLRVAMRDGTVLLTDHYYPRHPKHPGRQPNVPTILVRSPYGRAGVFGLIFARPFAVRGFQVLMQSCRGTFGSGGTFDAFRNEQSDGLDTLAWLKTQPWFSGKLGTVGASYLGLVQWAVAAQAGGALKAMGVQVTGSEFRSPIYPGESFGLDTALTWIQGMAHQEEGFLHLLREGQLRAKEVQDAAMHLPLRDADLLAAGKPVSYYRDWLEHNAPDDHWWGPAHFSSTVGAVSAPVNMVGGWYDIFLPQVLADYNRLRRAGKRPYLTIGPWVHTSPQAFPYMVRESLAWFRTHLLGEEGLLRKAPVRVFVMGRNKWKGLPDWPPPGYHAQRWFVQSGNGLAPQPPTVSEAQPDRYRYDPAYPTPAVGGSSLSRNSGPKDNRAVEARKDVLVYTSPALEQDIEVIGEVRAELFVRSSLEHTDFFVRLCDVDPKGKSINISDGLVRLRPGEPEAGDDGVWKVGVEMWATAQCFRKGHRIRVQVAGGSHPRYARNTGSGEPLATSTTLIAADHTVYHDAEHPSAIILPVKSKS
jgi:putative CocE/NonD family hydrolase